MNVPAEYMEKDFPIRILRNNLRNGSAGAGEYRGGLGLDKVFEITRGEVSTSCRIERHYSQPWGIFGGLSASKGAAWVIRQTGEKEEFTKRDMTLYQGDQLYILAPGGGGYGDPLKRQPELVLKDVLDRRISLEAAAEDYGVVINRESMALDLEKTTQLREEKAKQRGPITWTYDRGPDWGRE